MRTLAVILGCIAVIGCSKGGGGTTSGGPSPEGSTVAAVPPSSYPPATPPPPASAAPSAKTAASAAGSADEDAPPPEGAKQADASLLTTSNKPIQGAVLFAKVKSKVKKISFPGHKTTILDDGEFMIGFNRNAPAKEKLALTLEDGSVLTREFDVEQRKYEVDKVDGLKKKDVDLDAPTKKKLAIASDKLDKLRMHFGDSTCFRETFKWPLKGKISSHYGVERVLNGEEEAGPHFGVDIVAAKGSPVRAPACGKVVAVEKDLPLSGNVVIVDHGRGLTSTFLHLDKFKVKVGDAIKQGEEIGTVGTTGRSNGAHLDWRMNLFDIRVDPELVAPPM
jgi:murein DD-endopeptidase MepM/ murein hydrolase activator NlpD